MDPATIRYELTRRRRLVGAVLVLAIVVGVLVTNKVSLSPPGLESRQETVGVASTRVLVDTPGSQVVNVNPKGSETLGERASLLASLMVDGVFAKVLFLSLAIFGADMTLPPSWAFCMNSLQISTGTLPPESVVAVSSSLPSQTPVTMRAE